MVKIFLLKKYNIILRRISQSFFNKTIAYNNVYL